MRCLLIHLGILLLASLVQSQNPVSLKAIAYFHGKQPETISLFNPASESKNELDAYVEHSLSLTLRHEFLDQIITGKPTLLRLQLPSPLNINLDLYQASIFSEASQILTSDGRQLPHDPAHIFYRGMINGNPNSLAVVSVFENRIQILYADENGNKRIQQRQDGTYIAFEDKDIKIPNQLNCFTTDSLVDHQISPTPNSADRMLTGNCVEVYVECDYQSYLSNGSSVSNTEEWVAELWNEVITLYEIEDIPVFVSDIFIYTATFPAFDTLTSTSAILNAFVTHMGSILYNGRLAHFMSTRGLGGGVAWLDVLCSSTHMCAVSTSLSTNVLPLPTYSWSVEVITHEMGHNMGSPHTHACAWNGNNTAIDGCGPSAGYSEGCNAALPVSGTIMSYCHLVGGVGINFNNGFGTQPGDLIRNRYNNAPCNTGACAPPPCTSLTNPVAGSINVDINADISWTGLQWTSGYMLTIGTTPGGSDILNNVDVGLVTTYNPPGTFPFNSTIYVKLVPYNSLGEATGCQFQSFSTEQNFPPTCTHMTNPANGATNVSLTAVIHWAHSLGNQTGYKLSIGTTPGGSQIANMLDVGNVNFWDPPGYLPHSSTIYVKITPYGSNGEVSGCVTESFTSQTPVNGDFCDMAINLPCGTSIAGNTTTAYPDSEAINCVANIEAPGIWYTFVGNGQNTVITTCSQYSYDTQLNAYTGSCDGFTCISGNDDYCAGGGGSLISFPTTNGLTYYILVQGWGGETGSYTLTRTCYSGPFYCPSQGNSNSYEYIKTMSFGNFTKQSGASNYSDFTGDVITVSRGATYVLQLTPQFVQSPRMEYYKVWIDYNKDGDFTDADENAFTTNSSSATVSGNVSIPLSASTGTTRMRVSMRYNSNPPICGAYPFGEVEDYSVNIRCNLVTNNSDTGNGSLRIVSDCADDNENILFASGVNGQTIILNSTLEVNGQWKWMATNGSNITVKAAAGVARLLTVPVGKTIEIQYLTLIGGTASLGGTIDNYGNLILRNSHVKPPPASGSIPISNKGIMQVFGLTDIMY